MPSVKEKMIEVIQAQPDDAMYEEIMRELVFERMIERGLDDSRPGSSPIERGNGAACPHMAEIG